MNSISKCHNNIQPLKTIFRRLEMWEYSLNVLSRMINCFECIIESVWFLLINLYRNIVCVAKWLKHSKVLLMVNISELVMHSNYSWFLFHLVFLCLQRWLGYGKERVNSSPVFILLLSGGKPGEREKDGLLKSLGNCANGRPSGKQISGIW